MIESTPNDIDFCGNGLKFEFNCQNYIINEGSPLVFKYEQIGILEENEIFAMKHPEKDEALEIRAADKMVDELDWNEVQIYQDINVTAEQLQNIYIINKYYNVTEDGTYIIFTAKEKGGVSGAYDFLGFTGSGYETASIPEHFTQGQDIEFEENFRVKAVLSVYDNESSEYKEILELTGYPGSEGVLDFYFGEFLQKYAIPDLPDALGKRTEVLKYKVEFTELWGDNNYSKTHKWVGRAFAGRSDEVFVINDDKYLNYNHIDFYEISKNDFINLSFFAPQVSGTYISPIIEITFKFKNKTGYTSTFNLGGNKYDIYQVRLSYNDLNMGQLEISRGSEIVYLEANIIHNGSELKKVITIALVPETKNRKSFLFLNKKGIWETISFNANSVSEMKTEKEIAKSERGNYHDILLDTDYISEVEGKLNHNQMISFIESFRCGHVYEIIKTDTGFDFKKIFIDNDNFIYKDTQKNLIPVKFKYYEKR